MEPCCDGYIYLWSCGQSPIFHLPAGRLRSFQARRRVYNGASCQSHDCSNNSGIYKHSLEDMHKSSLLWILRHAALSCLSRISVLSTFPLHPHSALFLTTRTMQSEIHPLPDNEVLSTLPILPHSPLPPTTRTMQSETTSPSDNKKEKKPPVPDIPPHWIFEREQCTSPHTHFCWWPPFHFLHHLICVVSWGHGSLVPLWAVSYPGCPPEVWEKERELVGGRLEHINTVVCFQQSLDQRFINFYCDFLPSLDYSFLRRLYCAPHRPLITQCYHMRTQFPSASSGCLSPFPSVACSWGPSPRLSSINAQTNGSAMLVIPLFLAAQAIGDAPSTIV